MLSFLPLSTTGLSLPTSPSTAILRPFLLLNPFNPGCGGKKNRGEKTTQPRTTKSLIWEKPEENFLEFSGFVINKREVSVLKIIFRVPVMRQNQRKWLATDVSMNYVCVADTHQHHLLLFPSQYTLNDKTHTCTHLQCQLTGELGLLKGCVLFFF